MQPKSITYLYRIIRKNLKKLIKIYYIIKYIRSKQRIINFL